MGYAIKGLVVFLVKTFQFPISGKNNIKHLDFPQNEEKNQKILIPKNLWKKIRLANAVFKEIIIIYDHFNRLTPKLNSKK